MYKLQNQKQESFDGRAAFWVVRPRSAQLAFPAHPTLIRRRDAMPGPFPLDLANEVIWKAARGANHSSFVDGTRKKHQ